MYIFARFDVFKLGVSGLEKSAKEDAQTALAIRFEFFILLLWRNIPFELHTPPQAGC